MKAEAVATEGARSGAAPGPGCWPGSPTSPRSITLLFLVAVFGLMSPSFLTFDNAGNILRQVAITGIIATGLTFVILTAEIDLGVASVANAAGIVVAFFTLQESYVNIANVPLPGCAGDCHGAARLLRPWRGQCRRRHADRHPLLHHDACHAADRGRHLRHAGARPDRLCRAGRCALPGLGHDRPGAVDRRRRRPLSAGRPPGADLHPLRPLRVHGRRQPRGGRVFRRQRQGGRSPP